MAIVSRKISVALAMALFAAATQGLAQTAVTEREDGAMELSMDGQLFLVPADIAEAVAAAVRDHADDPRALRQAIRAIVAESAGGAGDAELATAIAALAIYRAPDRSAIADAIMRGAAAANPGVSAPILLTILAAPGDNPRTRQARDRRLAQLQATAENPFQISPVQ